MVATLALLAALTRVVAPWSSSYQQHLAYAGATWIVAVVVWGAFCAKDGVSLATLRR